MNKFDCPPFAESPFMLSRFKTLMQSYVNENVKDLNISSIHVMYLALLTKKQKLKQTEFTKMLGYNKANSSRVLAELESKRYIFKDGSFYLLTDAGIRIGSRITSLLESWKELLFDGVNRQDRETFEHVMQTIIKNSKIKIEQLKEKEKV